MKSPLVATFQDFRRILGVCPCCGEVFRLTDLMIAYRAKPTVTWLDRLEADEDRQQRAEGKFAEEEQRIRELAKERGRQALPRLLREAEPVFACRGYFAHDVKPLFDPDRLHHLRRNECLVGGDTRRPVRWPSARARARTRPAVDPAGTRSGQLRVEDRADGKGWPDSAGAGARP